MVQEPVETPPRSQVVVPARMTVLSTKTLSNDVMIETREVKGVYVGRTLLPNNGNRFNICVAKTSLRPRLLAAGTKHKTQIQNSIKTDRKTSHDHSKYLN